MIRNFKKISYIFLIFVVIVMFFNINTVTADTSFMDEAREFLTAGEGGNNNIKLSTPLEVINNLLLGIGIGVSVLIATVMGIKFIIGSVEQKAEIKEMLIPFVLGCVILFGAIGIFRLVINAFNTAM